MFKTKEVAGIPFYVCETPTTEYREIWHRQLCAEMSLFFEGLPKGILLRGSHDENLDRIAQNGFDERNSSLIYVVPYHDVYSIYYPFSKATTAMLIYRSSGLVKLIGDAENMNVNIDRYQFIVHPKEALLGIIDLKKVQTQLKRLRSLDREMSHHLGYA